MTKAEMEGVIWDLQKKLSAAEAKFEAARLEIHRQEEYLRNNAVERLKVPPPDPLRERLLALAEKWNGRGGLYAGCAKSLVGAMSKDARP